jgi:hypothetical protein
VEFDFIGRHVFLFEAIESGTDRVAETLEKAVDVVVCEVCGRYFVSKGPDSIEYFILVPEPQ